MSAIRIVFHVVIGIRADWADDGFVERAAGDLDVRLTRLTGGVTRFNGTGTWTPQSQEACFAGPIERDFAVNYLISVPASHEEATLDGIRESVAGVVRDYRLPVRHIHVTRTICEERIFCVDDQELEPGGTSSLMDFAQSM